MSGRTMLFTRPMQVSAVRSISEIEEEQSSIQSELNGLVADMVSLVTDMTDLESQITSKTQEIAMPMLPLPRRRQP